MTRRSAGAEPGPGLDAGSRAGPGEPADPGKSAGAAAPGRRLKGLSARQVAEALGLEPHREGGFFRETYRAAAMVRTTVGERPVSTAILYLLTGDSASRFHRLASDELWFYHAGDPAELWLLEPRTDGAPEVSGAVMSTLLPIRAAVGPDDPCALVPARWWMGGRVFASDETDAAAVRGAGWTLVSCLVTPGFEYEDFELADRESLLRDYPAACEIILELT